jgi:hypothetical protein
VVDGVVFLVVCGCLGRKLGGGDGGKVFAARGGTVSDVSASTVDDEASVDC